MLQFLIRIDLKPHAKFYENLMKALLERTALNLTSVTSVFPPYCNHLWTFILMSFQYSKFPWCKL